MLERNWRLMMKKAVFCYIIFSLIVIGCASTSRANSERNVKLLFEDAENTLDTKEYDKAISKFKEILKIDKKHSLALSGLGFAYYCKNEYDLAINYCNQAIKNDNNNERAYRYLGYIYSRMDKKDNAMSFYNQAIRISPNKNSYIERSRIHYDRENYDLALNDLDEAIKLDSYDEHALILRAGINLYQKGKYQNAIQDATKAIEINDNNDVAFSIRAAAYFHLENYGRGLQDARKSLNINPKNDQANRLIEYAMEIGLEINDAGKIKTQVNLHLDYSISDYINKYPYLIADSNVLLIDNRDATSGRLIRYTFDRESKMLSGILVIELVENSEAWLRNQITYLITENHNFEEIKDDSLDRLIIDVTPFFEESPYTIYRSFGYKGNITSIIFTVQNKKQ
jgi:tetratricopeptide (TPR) repeat protein